MNLTVYFFYSSSAGNKYAYFALNKVTTQLVGGKKNLLVPIKAPKPGGRYKNDALQLWFKRSKLWVTLSHLNKL